MPEFDLDLDSFRKEFEENYEETETEETEDLEQSEEDLEETEDESETEDEELESETEEDESEEESESKEEAPKTKKTQTPEENAAFAEMRRKNEALQKQAAVVEKAAARYGMTVDQYLAAVEEQEAKERAEKQGIPVDVLRRLEKSESQLNEMTVQQKRERFFGQIETTKAKYGLEDTEVNSVFQYIGQNGHIDPNTNLPTISFEDAYKLANFDSITERKVKEAKQKQLADKKARQKKSAISHTNEGTNSNKDTEEITDEFVLKRLQSRNLL